MRCLVENDEMERCKNEVKHVGICATHAYRLRRYGDVQANRPIRKYDLTKKRSAVRYEGDTEEQRFWARVRKTSDCWYWEGSRMTDGGTGQAIFEGFSQSAVRIMWILTRGSVPEGARVRTTCSTPTCVRHIELEVLADA